MGKYKTRKYGRGVHRDVGWFCGSPEETTPNSGGGAGLCKVGRSTHNRNEQRDVFQEEGPLG